MRTRLNKLSVEEITIAAQGERNIVVELPDVSDPQQAKAMIGKAAILEFKNGSKSMAERLKIFCMNLMANYRAIWKFCQAKKKSDGKPS